MMVEGPTQRLTTEQRVFVVKSFFQTSNKTKTCHLFLIKKFNCRIKSDTVADIVDRLVENGAVGENRRSGRPPAAKYSEKQSLCEVSFLSAISQHLQDAAHLSLVFRKPLFYGFYPSCKWRSYRPRLVQQLMMMNSYDGLNFVKNSGDSRR